MVAPALLRCRVNRLHAQRWLSRGCGENNMTVNRRLLVLLVAHGLAGGVATAEEPATPLYRDASQPIAQRIDDLLGRMTLEEKIGQMNMPCVYVSELGNT